MRHITCVTKTGPVAADTSQLLFCKFVAGIQGLLGFMGGAAPSLNYLADKCDLTPEA